MQFQHIHTNFPKMTQVNTEDGRYYVTPEGNHYDSITTILGRQPHPELDAWREKEGAERADQITQASSKRGTGLHKLCEDYLNNVPHLEYPCVSSKLIFHSVRPHLKKINNIRGLEVGLYSDKLKAAGTTDCIADYDEVLSIIDHKNSRRIKKREWIDNYFIQTAFYAIALHELTGLTAKQLVIIMGSMEGESKVFIEPTKLWIGRAVKLIKELRG